MESQPQILNSGIITWVCTNKISEKLFYNVNMKTDRPLHIVLNPLPHMLYLEHCIIF